MAYDTNVPGAGWYDAAVAAAAAAYQKALTMINSQRGEYLHKYGYRGTIDAKTGSIKGLGVDPTNAYGALQQMFRAEGQAGSELQQVNEERGLYGGLANQGESSLKYAAGAERGQLGSTLQSGLNELQHQQDDSFAAYKNALWQAQAQQLNLALNNGQFDPAAVDTAAPTSTVSFDGLQNLTPEQMVAAANQQHPFAWFNQQEAASKAAADRNVKVVTLVRNKSGNYVMPKSKTKTTSSYGKSRPPRRTAAYQGQQQPVPTMGYTIGTAYGTPGGFNRTS